MRIGPASARNNMADVNNFENYLQKTRSLFEYDFDDRESPNFNLNITLFNKTGDDCQEAISTDEFSHSYLNLFFF